jgi:hypothetical protein
VKHVSDRLRPTVPAYGVIAVKAAEQHPPTLCTGTLKNSHHPTEIGRVAHRSIQGDKEPLKLREVVALIVAHVFDVDIAGLLLDGIDIRRFISVAAVRYGAIEITAGHTSEGDKPLVFFGEGAGGKYRDRGRIQPAAKKAPDRMSAAHLPAHRQIKTLA